MGRAVNQLGEEPAANADSNEFAKLLSWTILLINDGGAAVKRAERTGAVGRASAKFLATSPRPKIIAGSVGRLIPATEALFLSQVSGGG